MRILFVNQFYAPDESATAELLAELAEDLAAAGHDVSVVASRGRYEGGAPFAPRERRGGVAVTRSLATSLGKGSAAARLTDYLSFALTGLSAVVVARRPDVLVALTTPPLLPAAAAAVARARGIPLVTWIQDVYPEVAGALGALAPDSAVYRGSQALMRRAHGTAARVVTLSAGMAARVRAQGAPEDRVRVIWNWADGERIFPVPAAANPFRQRHGLGERFVLLYSGNVGLAHDLSGLVEAMRRLEARCPRLVLLVVGAGGGLPEVRRRAAGLGNVRFLPRQPREELAESLSAADLHCVALRPGLEGLVVPSKLYGALAAGRPVLYLGPPGCEVARTVRELDAGWIVDQTDPAAIAERLAEVYAHPPTTATTARLRAAFTRELDRSRAVARWEGLLGEVVEERAFHRRET